MDAYALLCENRHHDPYEFLGQHPLDEGWVLRVWAPECRSVALLQKARGGKLKALDLAADKSRPGLFEIQLEARLEPRDAHLRYTAHTGDSWEAITPYIFDPLLGDLDLHLIGEGRHLRLWEILGAHHVSHQGVEGVRFAVWAPTANGVSVVGEFNHWNGRRHPMRARGASGVWELFYPGLCPGDLYRFEIHGADSQIHIKSDPMARCSELRPSNASRVAAKRQHQWKDDEWITRRRSSDPLNRPISIYEVHMGSWRHPWDGRSFHNYRELGGMLVEYLREMNFTHVELMPVMEHPLDASWGYQVTGYFCPTSRYGSADDLRAMVDELHQAGFGVILDWVPAHFPKDAHGLRRFDGSPLYEHADPRQGEHPDWGTMVFNFGRNEVRNFLISNALYWVEEFHIDGLRVDAVASMLYLDYSRKEGEWVSNRFGGRENLEAIEFLREYNSTLFREHPGILSIAEESTSWPGVSRPVHLGGLGFNYKWNMGWMNDTLSYMQKDPVHRRFHHNLLSFSMVYAWTENFHLVLSHDEVVHGKGSLLSKMPGDEWQRFANLRLLYGWMWAHPGRKLLFMGGELAQWQEWQDEGELNWSLLQSEPHAGVQNLVRDLNRLMQQEASLWQCDLSPEGFRWINVHDAENSTFAFVRMAGDPADHLVVVANFTPVPRTTRYIGVPHEGAYDEVLNTDAAVYGGSNLGNGGRVWAERTAWDGFPCRLCITLPPLAMLIFKPGH